MSASVRADCCAGDGGLSVLSCASATTPAENQRQPALSPTEAVRKSLLLSLRWKLRLLKPLCCMNFASLNPLRKKRKDTKERLPIGTPKDQKSLGQKPW